MKIVTERACSREVILSFFVEGNGSFAGDEVSKMSEEEFRAVRGHLLCPSLGMLSH